MVASSSSSSSSSSSRCALPPTVQYRPNAWEHEWRSTIAYMVQYDDPRNWTQGCEFMAQESASIKAWLEFARQRRPAYRWANKPPNPSEEAKEALSFYATLDACTKRVLSLEPIEPLVGFLRHPQAHCVSVGRHGYWTLIRDKNYLVPSWRQEVWPRGRTSTFLFDLGASLYHKGIGGASTSWFVDEYRARGIVFDRIFAWEAKPHADVDIYAPVPFSVADRMSYYNVPVDAREGARHNPWRTLRAMTTPEDFVVVKIDIDNSTVEEPLVAQLLADRALAARVDEIYYEHHVRNTPMWRCCWKQNTVTNHMLADSYEVFSRLRELGIRAHSWV